MSNLAPAVSGEWTDELLFDATPDTRFDETGDGTHVVSLESLPDGRSRLGWDGTLGQPFELLNQRSGATFEWSAGALHVACYGRRGDRFFVWVDGVEHLYEGVTRSVPPTWSDDGNHLAYGVYVDGRTRLVLDGEIQGDWLVAPVRPVFSPDGSRFAFVAENRELKPGENHRDYRQRVVLDGQPEPEANAISAEESGPQFSPDGRRFVYGRVDGNEVRLVVDGAMTDPAPNMGFPRFSFDSRQLAYFRDDKGRFVLAGERGTSGNSYWRTGPPVFSPDSTRLAFLAFRSKNHLVAVIDGVEGPEFTDAWGDLTFSPDSRHTAYLGLRRSGGLLSRSTKASLVRDGVEGRTWDEVSSYPHFSPDSAHIAFAAREGKARCVVVDDVATALFSEVSPPRFGPTGRLAYLAAAQDVDAAPFRIMVEGIAAPALIEAGIASGATEWFLFSADGDHVATVGRVDDYWRPIVDGHVGPGGSGAGSARFDGARASFLVAADDGPHRVTTESSEQPA